MQEGLYVLMLALFITHELDAIARHEWRMFPVTSRLDDARGFAVFLLAHAPVFGLILWFSFEPTAARDAVRGIVAAFAIVHVGLHMIYARHPANEFNNALSQALIWSTGVAGALYLAASFLLTRTMAASG